MKLKFSMLIVLILLVSLTLVGCKNNNNSTALKKIMDEIKLLEFNDKKVDYNGNEKSIYLEGDLPEGIEVEYINNNQTEPGVYKIQAKLKDTYNRNLDLPTFEATLTIYGSIVIGAMSSIHVEVLEATTTFLREKGYKIQIKEYYDYIALNHALNNGEIDGNFFQHEPFLQNYNKIYNTSLVSAGKVFFLPNGLYSKEFTSLTKVPKGTKILIPDDKIPQALLLLNEHGLIEVDSSKNLKTGLTINDIIDDNGYNIEISESYKIIYNYKNRTNVIAFMSTFDANLNEIDTLELLVAESSTSEIANLYGNIIAVKEENKNNPKILALIEVLKSQELRDFISQKFEGKVAPVLD